MKKFLKTVCFLTALLLMVASGSGFAKEGIQTQTHNTFTGIEVDLLSIETRNNVLTVKFKVRNTDKEKQSMKFNFFDCYVLDEINQKKYFALKDADGMFIGGPFYDNDKGGRFWFDIAAGKPMGIWIKFPEPTGQPKSITLSIPDLAPFEEVSLGK